MNEETTIAQQFQKEHLEEILAAKGMVAHISEELNGLKKEFPNIGFMLHVGIMDPVSHWCQRVIDIDKIMAAEILRDELQEEDDIRQWVLENLDKGKGEGYIQHFDPS